jgi:8-oxo-dGTP diphosphatase
MPAIEIRAEAILVRSGRVLLVNHEKRGASYWVLPGGHVERGETLEQALAREMQEELKLDVAVGALAIVHDFITADRHVVNHSFRVTARGEPQAVPQQSLKAAKWVPLGELESLDLRPPIAKVLRRIVEETSSAAVYLPGV